MPPRRQATNKAPTGFKGICHNLQSLGIGVFTGNTGKKRKTLDIAEILANADRHDKKYKLQIDYDTYNNTNCHQQRNEAREIQQQQVSTVGTTTTTTATATGVDVHAFKYHYIDEEKYRQTGEMHIVTVDSEALCTLMENRGFKKAASASWYNSGEYLPYCVEPSASSNIESDAPVAERPPPEEVLLPEKVPTILAQSDDKIRPQLTFAEKVIEAFEVKVIDFDGEKIYSPIKLWTKENKKKEYSRKQNGKEEKYKFKGASLLLTRLKAYYAAKVVCDKPPKDNTYGAKKLILLATQYKQEKNLEEDWIDLCLDLLK